MNFRISYLRALACILVVLLHVSGEEFGAFSDRWAAANIYAAISRVCVPIFFMIAGATLLGKVEPLGEFFSKRVIRIGPPILFWSAIYIAWSYYWMRSDDWPIKFINGQAAFHLWYLYSLIGIYAFIPLLRRLYQSGTNGEIALYLGGWAITSTYMTFKVALPASLQSLLEGWHLWQFYGNTGYLLLGACLYDDRLFSRLGRMSWGVVFIVAFAVTTLSTYYYSHLIGTPSQLFYSNLSPNIILLSAAVFSLVLRVKKLPQLLDIPIQSLSSCSLGIYGIHVLIVGQLTANWGVPPTIGSPWTGPLISTVAALGISFAVVRTLRFLPFMRSVA
ncbi:acyltransferase family protein [Glaciimonas sp. Gout2]|uniref:acyltransferase n=1 Tax=unclassified Glaciimonas TaxID=2644401 RepID=UPI002B23B62F|nr:MULTISPECIES: acyltransferase family protein [unclassified Glaciimonas]MEB0013426.1 acyltransferase family protein [Glaciimonas sp. Cout2]MEB0082663.1 acyltransferase family protein [Glaciimonas sp. Gout2]